MADVDVSTLRDTRIPFRYVRPRVLGCLMLVLAGYLSWLAMDPTRIDAGSATGFIDLAIRASPMPVRSLICASFAVTLVMSAYTTFWPCIRRDAIVLFDGRRLFGFDAWGHAASLPRSDVRSVSYRYGGASIKGETHRIWMPLSSLDVDVESRDRIRAFLD